MIITPSQPTYAETIDALRLEGRERAKIFAEWFPLRYSTWFYRWPTWIMAGTFVAMLGVELICGTFARDLITIPICLAFLDTTLMMLGLATSTIEVYVQLCERSGDRRPSGSASHLFVISRAYG